MRALADPKECRRAALDPAFTDQEMLGHVAFDGRLDRDERLAVIAKLKDEAALVQLATKLATKYSTDELAVSDAAFEKLSDESLLALLPNEEIDWRARAAAVTHLRDQATIDRIAARHQNSWFRLKAVGKVADQALLASIAVNDNDESVREAAVDKLVDQAALARVVAEAGEAALRAAAVAKLEVASSADETALERVAAEAIDWEIRGAAIARLADPAVLAEFAFHDPIDPVREAAIARIADPATLAKIALEDPSKWVRAAAVRRLDDQDLLARILREDKTDVVRQAAVVRLKDEPLLARAVFDDSYWYVCRDAFEKLTDMSLLAEIACRHSGAWFRSAAVARLSDRAVIEKIAAEDANEGVRRDAADTLEILALTDPEALREAANKCHSLATTHLAVRRITDQAVLRRMALDNNNREEAIAAAEQLTDAAMLAEVAETSACDSARLEAVRNPHFTDPTKLAWIATKKGEWSGVRRAAVEKLSDQKVLAGIASGEAGRDVCFAALERVHDPAALARVVATSPHGTLRATALLGLASSELQIALARGERDVQVRTTAILLLTDQAELRTLATVEPRAAVRATAIIGLDDDAFLLDRIRDDSSAAVRAAGIRSLRQPDSIVQAATRSYFASVRTAALTRLDSLGDSSRAQKVRDAQAGIENRERSIGQSADVDLVRLAIGGEFDVWRLAAVARLERPADLQRVAMESTDREVTKVALNRLTEKAAFDVLADQAPDAAVRLAAAQKAGRTTWSAIFEAAKDDPRMLGDATAAVALFTLAQPDAKEAVTQTCLDLIRRGDESRIPEMADLLDLYGDTTLAEDYLNCGQPDLDDAARGWASRHGYSVGSGSGSSRAQWGSGD